MLGSGHTEVKYIPVSNVHDYGEWVTTVYADENTDGEEVRICKNDSSHTQTRTILPAGTAGLSFMAINNGNEYSVSLGSATATDIVIPDTIYGSPITVVADMGFYNSDIQSITLGKNITLIENLAFGRCTRLTNIEIPSATTEIGMWAFYACENLIEVSFKNGSRLKTVGYRSFLECKSLKNFESSSVTYLAEESLKDCYSLKRVAVPNAIYIGNSSFSYCESLEDIVLPNTVTTIGGLAFSGCKSLKSINIPSQITDITSFLFSGCDNLTDVKFASDINLKSIGMYAFAGCKSLKSIVIPKDVAQIEAVAFAGCDSLTDVYYGGTNSVKWQQLAIGDGNSELTNAARYYYSATKPSQNPNSFWRYVNRNPVVWG